MEGNKTTSRRTGRTESARPAVTAEKKESAKAVRPRPSAGTDEQTIVTPEQRWRMVEMAAYFRAERRGFAPGHEVADWVAAEAEVDVILLAVPEGKPIPKRRKARAD